MNREVPATVRLGARRPLLGLGLMVAAAACLSSWAWAAEPAPSPPAEQIEFFEKQIRPLLVKNCVDCHGPDAQEAGLRLDTRAGLLHGAAGAPIFVPGKPDQSKLVEVTRYTGKVQMPPDGKMPSEAVAALAKWVELGAPWPVESAAPATGGSPAAPAAPTIGERIAQARAGHWALQPVRRPELPAVRQAAWVQTPVDAFILARLEREGLGPAPPADRRALLRRVYFDLWGLPPTFEEVEAFVADTSPDALARVVDRLLDSPRYGERWGRHWLDLARYGDTRGYTLNGGERRYPYAYTYRDYVIRAFQDDKPFDQFVLEQLAADLLPSARERPETLAALGFLTVGRRFLSQHDTLDDRIDVTIRGLQGLTVGCARCHDHKFDPLTMGDYYALYGVFNSVDEPGDLPLLGPEPQTPEYADYAKKLAALEAEVDALVTSEAAKLTEETRARVVEYVVEVARRRLGAAAPPADPDEPGDMDLRPRMIDRWRVRMDRAHSGPDPVWRVWRHFTSVPPAELPKHVTRLLAELRARVDSPDPAKRVNARAVAVLEQHPPKTLLDVAETLGRLLAEADAAWKRQQAEKGPGQPADRLPDAALEELRQELYAPGSPAVVLPSEVTGIWSRAVRNKYDALRRKVDEHKVTHPGAPPRGMVVVDAGQPREPRVFLRGNPATPGPQTPRRFLEVLAGPNPPEFPKTSSGRLELARAIVDPQNPLTARVLVNRVWSFHFGRGLVDTPSDFGVRTPPPTHPELLDWLAADFMAEGWSIKRLHRAILLSATYQQASGAQTAAVDAAARAAWHQTARRAEAVDPENRLLWRQHRRRLELEPMRDAMLAVAGRLDLTAGGRPVELWQAPYSTRRTVYGFIDRQDLPGVFRVFDFADPDVSTADRPETTVPQQALFALNSPFVREQAQAASAKARAAGADEVARIDALVRLVWSRRPSAEETARCREFLAAVARQPRAAPDWQYGYGTIDEPTGRVTFTALPHWTGSVWQAGPEVPNKQLGYTLLRAGSGHPGNAPAHSTILRWTASFDGAVEIEGLLGHDGKEGDGVRARVVSSRGGILGQWTAERRKTPTALDRVEVRAGDTLDFIVDCRGDSSFDGYTWGPVVRQIEPPGGQVWNSARDFHGPLPPPPDALDLLAQVLLMANEFVFVD